jgi:CHAT domain-containing protein
LFIPFIIASNSFAQYQSQQISLSQRYNNALDLNRYQLENKLARVSPLFKKRKEATDLKHDHCWSNIQPGLLAELYHSLINKPAQDLIKQNVELIIVPDNILFYFPFEILVTEMNENRIKYLVERSPIACSASASLLNPLLRKAGTARRELLALGNPYFGEGQKKGFLDWFSSVIQYRSIFRGDKFQLLPNV